MYDQAQFVPSCVSWVADRSLTGRESLFASRCAVPGGHLACAAILGVGQGGDEEALGLFLVGAEVGEGDDVVGGVKVYG